MEKILPITIALFISFSTIAQEKRDFFAERIKKVETTDTLVIWDKNRKLTIPDFQGTPKKKSDTSAVSSCYFIPVYKIDSPMISKVICVFNKKTSWYTTSSNDDYTLVHEQGHFDIAEVFARKLQDSINKITIIDDSIEYRIYLVHKSIMNDCMKVQQLYDLETSGSTGSIVAQKEWADKIRIMLEP